MVLPTLSAVLNWRNEKNKSGLYSTHLRVTIDRGSKYFKIDVPKKISAKEWNGTDDQWVKLSHVVV
jgi:glycosidase